MKVSQDELKSLFKQVFEACGYEFGQYEVAAESIVWAQMHGFDVLSSVEECLVPLDQKRQRLKIKEDKPLLLILDNQGAHALANASQIVNLGCAKALDRGHCRVQVQNCTHSLLLSKLLCDASSLGLYINGVWIDGRSQTIVELILSPAAERPEISFYNNDSNAEEDLWLMFSKQELTNYQQDIPIKTAQFESLQSRLSSQSLEERYENSLDDGLLIPGELWRKLQVIAAEVLVESNERSRAGAGS